MLSAQQMRKLKAVKMKRWPRAVKVLHTCPACDYAVFKPGPAEAGNCPRCAGDIPLPPIQHEFNVPEHKASVLESVVNLETMTDKLEE